MKNKHSRRDFIKLASAGSFSLFTFTALGGCEQLLEEISNRPIRRDISSLSASDPIIQTYRDAISAMKALPSADPRNWNQQASIHLNDCAHANWFFLPWHRAYLYHFEEICRELTGNEEFALPYWNWTKDPQIPAVFWGGSSNPMFNSTRTATASSTASSSFVGTSVVQGIQNETNFILYASGQATNHSQYVSYGALEQTPHNYVHGFVGGDMGAFMSPLDPIFWTHHNMIDCLWADWNIHRQNPNTNDSQWTQYDFSGSFVDRAGNPATNNVISTVLMPLLSYRFEDCFGTTGTGSAEAEQDTMRVIGAENTVALRKFLREGAPVELEFIDRVRVEQQVRVVPNEPMTVYMNLDRDSFRRALSQDESAKILLTVGDVQLPEASDIFMRVFVNMPEASADTPLDDPHYAGSFAFFVDPEAHQQEHEPPDYLVNITDALYRLRREGILGNSQLGEVGIQLVAVPFPNREIRAKAIGLNFLDLGIVRTNERENQQ